jgi:LPS-assembly protein
VGSLAAAQPALPEREPNRLVQPAPRAEPVAAPADAATVFLEADRVEGIPDRFTEATGKVQVRRADVLIEADRVRIERVDRTDRLRAEGRVQAVRGGDRFSGSAFELDLGGEQGFLLSPTYFFELTGAGGRAARIDLLGRNRAEARAATYTSCPMDGSGDPDWLLTTSRVRLDFEANEGVAEGAVLRFMGVPFLALPVLSFPLTSERKSGWLPPALNLDTQSGLAVAVPYYWNIAPHLDATFTPRVLSRRGLALDTEFRYLDHERRGIVSLDVIARDALTGERRYAFGGHHDGSLSGLGQYHARWLRVSDDAYWKDFSRSLLSTTPRLLPTDFGVDRRWGDWTPYARVQRWQVLQDTDPAGRIVAPYQRTPQLGVRWAPDWSGGWQAEFETEFNRFTLPRSSLDGQRPDGDRWHAVGSIAHTWAVAGARITPKAGFNAAAYRNLSGPLGPVDASGGLPAQPAIDIRATRLIPTLSLDGATTLERDAMLFGRPTRQTLEPRLLYVRTAYRPQATLPNFDAAGRDFNFESLYADNAFSGIDRVSDADQLTAGVTTRVFDAADGGELLRLAMAQRLLFRDQLVTPDGTRLTQRFSDALLVGTTRLVPSWTLDAGVQYSPEIGASVRTLLGARFSPGPFRTVSANYRFTRGVTEQVDFGWQWPLAGAHPDALSRRWSGRGEGSRGAAGSDCSATWYGVGRLNYSLRDSRVTDSLLGVEYDSGCWIGRLVAERLSTGRSQATTRLLFQLELVGLSRLGANPLQVLKDNVPGYQLLRSREAGALARPVLSP